MQFTNEQFNEFRKDLKKSVAELEKKYKVDISPKNISYSASKFELKLEVLRHETNMSAEQEEFNRLCCLYDFTENDYKKQFLIRGKTFELVGFNPTGKKNKFKIRDVKSGENYVCAHDALTIPVM